MHEQSYATPLHVISPLDFYLQAHRNIVNLFGSANVLLSTAPLLHNNAVTDTYRAAFDFSHSPAEAWQAAENPGRWRSVFLAHSRLSMDRRSDITAEPGNCNLR
jgi:hypothetical protein